MSLLTSIHSPADLKPLNPEQLKTLAAELRDYMIQAVSETGGHLASSLGAVELTLALYKIYSPPTDRIIWDVGHQAYAHKIVTGRREEFRTLRQHGGMCGFPKREESPYDPFSTGHSSTSISVALGMARARDLAGEQHKVVAVIGDGSISNGLALEALNDAGHRKTDLLVILNDNRMSISKPVGGLSNYLNQIITGNIYNRLKLKIEQLLASIPKVGRRAVRLTQTLEELGKGLIVPGVLFEELGFRYLGPVNGHDLNQLLPTLERVRALSGPILLHVLTVKGKGFEHAERDPEGFHGTPRFDAKTGERRRQSGLTYSQAFARALLAQAEKNSKVVAIVAAMTSGTALDDFAAALPDRFFDVGIAESHAVTLAGGLAAAGFRPVVAIYSTFLQRAYDQILHDLCLQNLPVVLALDRAGVVGEDGPTHHGVFDLAYLRHLPNLAVAAPSDANELAALLATALRSSGPTAIRYPRGTSPNGPLDLNRPAAPCGQGRLVRPGQDVAILGLGNMLQPSLEAAAALERRGIQAAVVDPRWVKPLDEELLLRMAAETGCLLTVEDHVRTGGFGSAVLEFFHSRKERPPRIAILGFPDQFIEHGSIEKLHAKYGLDAAGIERAALELLEREPHGSGKRLAHAEGQKK